MAKARRRPPTRKRGGRRPGAGRPKGTRDRKARKGTRSAADREISLKVAHYASEGWAPNDIATVLELKLEDLQQRFAHELANGHLIMRAHMLDTQRHIAEEKGTNAAVNDIIKRIDLADEPELPFATQPKAEPQLGKKEQRAEAAKTAGQGTDWGGDLETPPIGELN